MTDCWRKIFRLDGHLTALTILHVSYSKANFFGYIGYVNGDRILAIKTQFFYFYRQETIWNLIEGAFVVIIVVFRIRFKDFVDMFWFFVGAIKKLCGNHFLHRNIIVKNQERLKDVLGV